MSQRTRQHVDAFWSMIDEVLNAVFFLLIGLEVFALHTSGAALLAGLIRIRIILQIGLQIGVLYDPHLKLEIGGGRVAGRRDRARLH
jgi:NhaP-type Na+/H+ or K+/H+ antiporter